MRNARQPTFNIVEQHSCTSGSTQDPGTGPLECASVEQQNTHTDTSEPFVPPIMEGLKEYSVRPEDVPVTEEPLREYKYKPTVRLKNKTKQLARIILSV